MPALWRMGLRGQDQGRTGGEGGAGCCFRTKVTYLRNVLEVKLIGLDGLLNMRGER